MLHLASACPDCPAGNEARARVFGPELWPTLLVALAPFALVVLIAWAVVWHLTPRRQRTRE